MRPQRWDSTARERWDSTARERWGSTVRGLVWLVFALAIGAGCNRVHHERAPDSGSPTGPSVVLVTIDTLRADHVGAYGAAFARTPVLDGLAAEGALFETAIAATPITLPSHASLLTGARPPRHGVRHNGTFRLGDALPTLAERFREAGYATGAVVGAVVLGERYGLGRGFDHYDDEMGTRKAGVAGFRERTAAEVTDAALAWLASVGDRPYFLWVHYYDAHLEHRAPADFAAAFPDRPYDAEIAYVDHELGRLRQGVEGFARSGKGEGETALWAVTSDHGESLGQHGELNHGMTLYDAAMHVPWILQGPGVPAARRIPGVVRAIDLAPTVLSLAGLPALETADGDDLSGLLVSSTEVSSRRAYTESLLPQLDFGWAPLHAVRTDAELYVRAPRPELYDLARDPGQENDLSGTAEFAARQAELDRHITAALEAGGSAERVGLDPDERARLQALGYALPEGPVVSTGLDPKDGLRYQNLIQEGSRALTQQRYADAEAALRAFLVHAPDGARGHGLLASTLLYTGRPAEALTHADRAIAIDPSVAHRFTGRAEIRAVLGDTDGARADFRHAATLDADDVWVQMGLMWVAVSEPGQPGALARAAEHARRAFSGAPGDAFVRLRVGMIWRDAGVYQAALESFRDAVRLRPDFTLAQARLAVEYARIGQLAAARDHRAQAGPWLEDATLGSELAWVFTAAGDPDLGQAHLETLEQLHPGNPRVVAARRQINRLLSRSTASSPSEGT